MRQGPAIDDEQLDFLSSELRQCLGHHPGVLGFHVQHIGMAAQKDEHAAYLFLALARAQVVDDTDSQRKNSVLLSEILGRDPDWPPP